MRMLRSIRSKVSQRKEAMFSAACCYHLWDWLSDECRRQVAVMERHAEDPDQPDVGAEEFEAEFNASRGAAPEELQGAFDAVIVAACGYWQGEPVEETEQQILRNMAWLRELEGQARLVRDIFGPRTFHSVTLNATWRTANVTALAQSIYTDRAFDRLPILADALEDAGCDNQDILQHCRSGDEHVRGCWVVDLVLGKE
jgi:hypothetical protein